MRQIWTGVGRWLADAASDLFWLLMVVWEVDAVYCDCGAGQTLESAESIQVS
jgi:hypothetical protein